MKQLAVVTGYSDKCSALVSQCISSCQQSVARQADCECTYFAYQLNWILNEKKSREHNPRVSIQNELKHSGMTIVDVDGCSIPMETYLPDITVYNHFARNFIEKFDYALFCHNDVLFYESDMIKDCVIIVDKPTYDIIAEPHIECSNIISARFYPHFIFVNVKKFLDGGLSFINDISIFDSNQMGRVTERDGGAGLMASYYRRRKMSYQPYTFIPPSWFTHIRMGNDNGVETFNLVSPDSPQFSKLELQCQKYVDTKLYG